MSRLAGRAYYLEEDNGREEFVKMMRAYEDVCGVEVLTLLRDEQSLPPAGAGAASSRRIWCATGAENPCDFELGFLN